MDVGALSLLIQSSGLAQTLADLRTVDAAAAKVGSKPAEVKVVAPTVGAVQQSFTKLQQTASAISGTPVNVRFNVPNASQADAAIKTLQADLQKATADVTTLQQRLALLEGQTGKNTRATDALSPKIRSAANGLTALAFAATAVTPNFQSMALAAGLAASSLSSFTTGALANWASGIGAAITIGVAFIGILDRMAGSTEAASEKLAHFKNIQNADAASAALARENAELVRLQDELGKADEKVRRSLLESGSAAGVANLGIAVFDQEKARRAVERQQQVVAEGQRRLADITREQAKSIANAQREAAVSAANDQLRITQSQIDRQESLNSQGYALGLLNLNQFFDARREILERRLDAEIAAARVRVAKLGEAPVGEKPDEAIRRRAEQASAIADLRILQDQRRQSDQQFMAEKEAAERQLAQRIAGFQKQILDAQGQTHAARLQQIEQEAKEFERTLAQAPGLSPQAKADMVNAFRESQTALANFNNAQRESQRIFEEIATERLAIQQRIDAGQITAAEGERQIAAAERARVPDLQRAAASMLEFATALKDPALIDAAKRLGVEIKGIANTPLGPLAERLKRIIDDLSRAAAEGNQSAADQLRKIQGQIDAAGGKVSIGIVLQAEWEKSIKEQIEQGLAQLEINLKPKNIVLSGVDGAIQQLNQNLSGVALGAGNSIGQALNDGFTAAFTKDSDKNFAEAAGNSLLKGIGGLMVQLGSSMVAYAAIMAVAAPLLAFTPFAGATLGAGQAAVTGAALIALGAGMGAIAANNTGHRTGGGGGRSVSSPRHANEIAARNVILDPDRRLRAAQDIGPTVATSGSRTIAASGPPTVINANFFGTPNAEAERFVAAAVRGADSRGIAITRRRS